MEEQKKEVAVDVSADTKKATLPGFFSMLGASWSFMWQRWDISLWYFLSFFGSVFFLVFAAIAVVVWAGIDFSTFLAAPTAPIIGAILAAFVAIILIYIFAVVLFSNALTYTVTHKERVSYWTGLTFAFNNFWSLFWIVALVSFVTMTGFLFLIIPAIIFGVYLAFAYLARMHHGYTGMEALRYSTYLVKGNWWGVFGRMLGVMVLYVVVYIAIVVAAQSIAVAFNNLLIADAISAVCSVLLTVFLIRAMGVVYHSLAEQKTAFDSNAKYAPAGLYTACAWIGFLLTIAIPTLLGIGLMYVLTSEDFQQMLIDQYYEEVFMDAMEDNELQLSPEEMEALQLQMQDTETMQGEMMVQ